ncbi:MAG: hypothetical protein LIO46_06465 [Clostridiales bacterium]|nr:hypothetical protein [Clostridiales bacterium]
MDFKKIKTYLGDKDNKIKLIVALGLAGILCILMSEYISFGGSEDKEAQDSVQTAQEISMDSFKETTEQQLGEIIGKIDGVGRCEVMVTIENSSEQVYAYDSSSEQGENSSKNEYKYIIINGEDGEEALLVKEIQPKIRGVIVVCEGGDNIAVQEKIISSVTAVFDISSNRVSINKMATSLTD